MFVPLVRVQICDTLWKYYQTMLHRETRYPCFVLRVHIGEANAENLSELFDPLTDRCFLSPTRTKGAVPQPAHSTCRDDTLCQLSITCSSSHVCGTHRRDPALPIQHHRPSHVRGMPYRGVPLISRSINQRGSSPHRSCAEHFGLLRRKQGQFPKRWRMATRSVNNIAAPWTYTERMSKT